MTTASDPEGRPTVMSLIEKGRGWRTALPGGAADYTSEGLLLMTNDGELANALTRAAARVEKTYLVKVSGKVSDSALNQLRHGVMIDRGSQVRPKPARRTGARQRPAGRVRPHDDAPAAAGDADNPWYELILIEGRNREIRKMFEEVGHHVEKIPRGLCTTDSRPRAWPFAGTDA